VPRYEDVAMGSRGPSAGPTWMQRSMANRIGAGRRRTSPFGAYDTAQAAPVKPQVAAPTTGAAMPTMTAAQAPVKPQVAATTAATAGTGAMTQAQPLVKPQAPTTAAFQKKQPTLQELVEMQKMGVR